MKKCRLPTDCVLAITYDCNARCAMCDIWKIKGFPKLAAEEFKKLPPSLRDINISGGEPFLRHDLPEITAEIVMACPRARIIISTNGFLTDIIIRQMKEILKIKPGIGVAVSIDGIGEMHDEMRGVPGGFKRDMETIKQLKALGVANIRLGFTITEKNIGHIKKVYDLSRQLGVEFTHSFAQSSEFYFGGKKNTDFQWVGDESLSQGMALGTEAQENVSRPLRELLGEQYEYLIKSELKSWNLKRWARAYFAFGMHDFISSSKSILSNAPGRDFFFLDPNGIIYPSVVHNFRMGDIKKISDAPAFEQFWCSQEAEGAREKTDKSQMPVWMVCTARTAIKKHPFKVLAWILKNKLFGFKLAVVLLCALLSCFIFPRQSLAAKRAAPRTANYYLAWEITDAKVRELAKWDLLILDMETQVNSVNSLKKIRQLNPNIIMLVYITPQEIKKDAAGGTSVMRQKLAAGISELWYLTDTQNNRITFWPGTWMLNVADNAPEAGGIKLNQYIAKFVVDNLLSTGLWDGVFYDNAWKDVKWLAGDLADLDKNGQKDSNIDAHWREGMASIYRETRRLAGNKYLLIGNATSDAYKNELNGIMLENFSSLGWAESMRVYANSEIGPLTPKINIINANVANKGNENDFKKFRFGLASALLLDGYYSFDFGDTAHAQTWWYDEYDIDLGDSLGSATSLGGRQHFEEDVWRREYKNGIAIVNSTGQPQLVDLGGEYEKITGGQDPAVNDGTITDKVSVGGKDGLVMLKVFETIKNIVFANGDFIRFFDMFGRRVRNGLFAYEENIAGGTKVYYGDLDGDGTDEKITAVGPRLQIFNNRGDLWFDDFPFGADYKGELRVAIGKLFDGAQDSIVIFQNSGGKGLIYNYHGAPIKENLFPLGKKYRGGFSIAVAKNNGEDAKIIVGTGKGTRPEVLVFNGNFSKPIKKFFVENKNFKGAFSVASGDINGDGAPEIIAAFNSGKNKFVKTFNLLGKQLSRFAVPTSFAAGNVTVGAADVNFDGMDEIILMNSQ